MDRETNANINTVLALHMIQIGAKATDGVKTVGKNMYQNYKIVKEAYDDPEFKVIYDNLLDTLEAEGLFGSSNMFLIPNPKFKYDINDDIITYAKEKFGNDFWNDEKAMKEIVDKGYVSHAFKAKNHYYTYLHATRYSLYSIELLNKIFDLIAEKNSLNLEYLTYEDYNIDSSITKRINVLVSKAVGDINKIKSERAKNEYNKELSNVMTSDMLTLDKAIDTFNNDDKYIDNRYTYMVLRLIKNANTKVKALPEVSDSRLNSEIYWSKDLILDALHSNSSFRKELYNVIFDNTFYNENIIVGIATLMNDDFNAFAKKYNDNSKSLYRDFRFKYSQNENCIYASNVYAYGGYLIGKGEFFKNENIEFNRDEIYFKNYGKSSITENDVVKFIEVL